MVNNKKDEVAKFLAARWLGTAEACCRIIKFDLYDGGPPVVALHVHLHKQQTTWNESRNNVEMNLGSCPECFFSTTNEQMHESVKLQAPQGRVLVFKFELFFYTVWCFFSTGSGFSI